MFEVSRAKKSQERVTTESPSRDPSSGRVQHRSHATASAGASPSPFGTPESPAGRSSGGHPLEPHTRTRMEAAFGRNFSHVRVHTDKEADHAARSVRAHAYSVGPHIAFASGRYTPRTPSGTELLAHELAHVVQQENHGSATTNVEALAAAAGRRVAGGASVATGTLGSARTGLLRAASTGAPPAKRAPTASELAATARGAARIGFVREEGLKLREGPNQTSRPLAQLRFGTRAHVIEDESEHPGWYKVAVPGGAGFVFAPRIHFPPPWLIEKDPALRLIRVKHGQTFWGLVKEQYGIQGNEGSLDRNINHFINAIRAVNKPEAFKVETDMLDDIGNAIIAGRDASDTLLKENVDLWIPSFGVAAAMDVGSGTVTGEIARFVRRIRQKLQDFKTACLAAGKYIPQAIANHAVEVGKGLLEGLIKFAIDAAKILAVSTAIGALIGSLFGGVGAIPGAEIGFEIGLLILKYYGLAQLIEMVLSIVGNMLSLLGRFISLAWNANGDKKVLEEAGKTLANALGILASAVLFAAAAYVMKKGAKALAKTKFAKRVGETGLAEWLAKRQRGTTAERVRTERVKTELADDWWQVSNVGPNRAGTRVPESFDLSVAGQKFTVHPNATKHMAEYAKSRGGGSIPISSLAGSVETAVQGGLLSGRNFIRVGPWELGIDTRGSVIYHAVYRP
jgi:hypothetical protein